MPLAGVLEAQLARRAASTSAQPSFLERVGGEQRVERSYCAPNGTQTSRLASSTPSLHVTQFAGRRRVHPRSGHACRVRRDIAPPGGAPRRSTRRVLLADEPPPEARVPGPPPGRQPRGAGRPAHPARLRAQGQQHAGGVWAWLLAWRPELLHVLTTALPCSNRWRTTTRSGCLCACPTGSTSCCGSKQVSPAPVCGGGGVTLSATDKGTG